MKSSININHPLSSILCGNNDYVYKLQEVGSSGNKENMWCKTDSNFHKIYSSSYFNDYDYSKLLLKENDYIVKLNMVDNYIKYSENFNSQSNSWLLKNLNINNSIKFTIPTIVNQAPRFMPSVIQNDDVYIEQKISENNGTLKLSVYIAFYKTVTKNPYISLGIVSNNYGYYCKTNFKSTFRNVLDSNYNEYNNNEPLNGEHFLSKLETIYEDNNYGIFKLSMVVKFLASVNIRCKLNLLTEYGDYIFSGADKRSYYISGFQLEEYKNISENGDGGEDNEDEENKTPGIHDPDSGLGGSGNGDGGHIIPALEDYIEPNNGDGDTPDYNTVLNMNKPYVYNNTNKPKSKQYIDNIAVVQNIDGILTPIDINNTLYYVLNGKESYNKGIKSYILSDIKPIISNQKIGDILILSNIITTKNKSNKTNPLKLGGSCDKNNDPLYSIYYDKLEKVYKIKTEEYQYSEDDVKKVRYENFVPSGSSDNKRKIARALTYNQGCFETWSSQGKCSFKHGYNTGGGFNFWKR